MNIPAVVYHVHTDGQKRYWHGETNRYVLRFLLQTLQKQVINKIKIKTLNLTFRYFQRNYFSHY